MYLYIHTHNIFIRSYCPIVFFPFLKRIYVRPKIQTKDIIYEGFTVLVGTYTVVVVLFSRGIV